MAKVKINRFPGAAESNPVIKVNKTIQPVSRDAANLEVEKDEFVVTSGNPMDGYPETYVAGGENHSNGGTPLSLGDKSFVFTKNPKQKITDENILNDFGVTGKFARKGVVPAELAKKYDINSYRKTLADPDTDKLQKETADRMIRNYSSKLGEIALVQEAEKGLPDGIPFISTVFMDEYGISPQDLVNGRKPQSSTANFTEGPVAKEGGQHKVRVLKRPGNFQLLGFDDGGEGDGTKAPPEKKGFVFNQDFLDSFMAKLGTKDISGAISPFMEENRGMVADTQHKKGATYGRKDWTGEDTLSDFKNRNAWYFKQNPDFDPKKESDVKAFQKAYNEKAVGMGLKPYFENKAGTKYSVDGKFGEVTFNTPNLEYTPAAAAKPGDPPPIPVTTGDQFVPAAPFSKVPDTPEAKAKFWTQDLMKMTGAGYELTKIKKYMPWEGDWETLLPDAVYYDPTRELASNSEQANMAEMSLNTFRGPQANSSRLSEIMGQSLSNAANILGKYNNMNVQVANQFEIANANTLNADSRARAARATSLYDKSVIANQQYDNAKRLGRDNLRKSMENAWTNRGRTQALNSMNKQYNVDPSTGFVDFTGKSGLGKAAPPDFDKMVAEMRSSAAYKGWEPKDIVAAAKIKLGLYDPNSHTENTLPPGYGE